LRWGGAGEQAVFAVVDEFAFLSLLHLLDQQAQLFLDLVERLAVKIGDARRAAFDVGRVVPALLHPVQAKDARLDRGPAEEIDQPAGRNAAPLRVGLCRVGELAGCALTQRSAFDLVSHVPASVRCLKFERPSFQRSCSSRLPSSLSENKVAAEKTSTTAIAGRNTLTGVPEATKALPSTAVGNHSKFCVHGFVSRRRAAHAR